MKNILLLITIVFVFFSGCTKDIQPPLVTAEVKEISTIINITSANMTVRINYQGNISYVNVLVSETSDLTDAQKFSSSSVNDVYTTSISNLKAASTYYYCYEIGNSINSSTSNIKSFTTKDYSIPILNTVTVSNINYETAHVACNIVDNGGGTITEKGFCWSLNSTPTISDNFAVTNDQPDNNFFKTISNLTEGTLYYVRAYAKNVKGIAYSAVKSFTTIEGIVNVTTAEITNITATTALSGGTINVVGGIVILDRGICWSTSQQPNISSSHTSDGNGYGSFNSNLSQLSPATTYYVRAYAKDNETIYYGDTKSFITSDGLATVITQETTNIATTSAICHGEVTDNGGFSVIIRGFCWSTSPNPTLINSNISCGVGNGIFSASIAGLARGTTYYVRAYATNAQGTSYGNNENFTTLP